MKKHISPFERALSWANARAKTLNTRYIFRIGKKYLAIAWDGKAWQTSGTFKTL